MAKLLPPAEYQRHFGHHWLQHNGNTSELMVLQWNPGSKTWSHSNCHDTLSNKLHPLNIEDTGWRWHSHIPMPAI